MEYEVSQISARIGLPVLMRKKPVGQESEEFNTTSASLFLCCNLKQEEDLGKWGKALKFSGSGNKLVHRRDGKPLNESTVKALCTWCNKILGPLFRAANEAHEAMGKVFDKKKAAEKAMEIRQAVLEEITREKFMAFCDTLEPDDKRDIWV